MAKVKVVKNNLDQNLNGDAFLNTASQTIFQFSGFRVTSNFEGRTPIDYSKELSTFVRPVTLETLNLTKVESDSVLYTTQNAALNLDRSDLNTFTKFGSAYEFLRVSVENIISAYPGSLYVNSSIQGGGNQTFTAFTYNQVENISKFKIPSKYTVNKFGLVYNTGNTSAPDDNTLKNLNLSYYNYVVWSSLNADDNTHTIIGFTGDSSTAPYITVECIGNPFPNVTGQTGYFDIHLKPNTRVFDDFRLELSDYERYIMGSRDGTDGFKFKIKDPTLLENGEIKYGDRELLWSTSDEYNIDTNTSGYRTFLGSLLSVGDKYDNIKTDLIARFLTPASLQTYDLTDDKKMNKLLRIYGSEFDQLKTFIDALVYVNKVTYNKKKNLPDQIVSNLARTFGWDYFQLVKEEELVDKMLEMGEPEKDLNLDYTPAEVDIELWRRILINTNYFWKSKGTRDAIKAMFLLIGIPEPFINITEYVYTVDGRIDPRSVPLTLNDLPSATLPYDSDGYPIAPEETADFYFQMSGNSDSGQEYLNNFRNVGFDLQMQVDNKKSWIEGGSTYRRHYSSPTYYQLDDELVLNTKEVDVALDTARGIEYDVWRYIKDFDFPANSTGFTIPFSYVNLSLSLTGSTQYKFELPIDADPEGDVEVRYNGTLLLGANYWDWSANTITTLTGSSDYYFTSPREFVIPALAGSPPDLITSGPTRDVIEATYIYKKGSGLSEVTVKYVVLTVQPGTLQAVIPMPETPAGDVQLTINGIAATKGTPQFVADFVVDGSNIVIQNPDLIAYFAVNPWVQMAYIAVSGSSDIYARTEQARVDSLCGGKIYFNNNANRTVVTMNYKIITPDSVKILVDGIALQPGTDYTVNPNNPYEVFLPPNINLGSVITSYYVVGDSAAFDPIIDGGFGLGDISDLSFLEFIELVQRRLINAANRKTITDFKGGWYPTLFKIYATYLHRSNPSVVDPESDLHTNGYTFENLYPFLNKYNAFFQKFVDQLLAATIIQRKGGLLIRNTIFTKQKFAYKRGVYMGIWENDVFRPDPDLQYFGSDGATYLKRPLTQTAEWTDDVVCITNPCNNFVVEDIEITYDTTTTTTTQFPYIGQLFIVEEPGAFTSPITDGNEAQTVYSFRFVDPIPLGYEVDMDLDFEFYFSGTTNANGVAQYELKRNGSSFDGGGDGEGSDGIFTRNQTKSITIGTGDIITVTLYTTAQASGGAAYTKLTVTPTITGTGVTPNGSIPIITPTSAFEEVYT